MMNTSCRCVLVDAVFMHDQIHHQTVLWISIFLRHVDVCTAGIAT
jgi:hypothetical protein